MKIEELFILQKLKIKAFSKTTKMLFGLLAKYLRF